MVELFEFDYQLEMYKPAAKRRWGYFALPILYGDRLVGKLDATADRKAGVLRVDAIHQDVPFTQAMTAAVHREIEDLARWLDLELVEDKGRECCSCPALIGSPAKRSAAPACRCGAAGRRRGRDRSCSGQQRGGAIEPL